jgi:hypothetical protein
LKTSRRQVMSSRAIRLLKISHKRHRPSRFFRCPGSRKWVPMDFLHLETSLRRFQQSRFILRPEGWLWVLRAIPLFKTSLKRPRPSCFFRCPGCRKWVGMTDRHLETSLHHLN